MSAEKMLTFEEWQAKRRLSTSHETDFENARIGTVPADDPMVLDFRGLKWPEWATEIDIVFTGELNTQGKLFKSIMRPTPPWKPSPKDLVIGWHIEYEDSYIPWMHGSFGDYRFRKDNKCIYALAESIDDLTNTVGELKQTRKIWQGS